jgi:hypothetical protein
MPVALAASYNVNSAGAASNQTVTTASFTPATGELIVVKSICDSTNTIAGTPVATGGGITWVKRAENRVASTAYGSIWTGIVTSGGVAITISVTISGNSGYISMTVERWSGAQLSNSPSVCYVNGSGAPTANMTIVGTGSYISWLNGDWNSQTGAVTYTGTATQDGYVGVSGEYTAYAAYQTASAGATTIGMTAPTGQIYTLLGIEIQVSGQANPTSGTMLTMGVGI